MIRNFDEVRKQLRELADVINAFKSEAVQLRLVELVFQAVGNGEKDEQEETSQDSKPAAHPGRRRRRRKEGGTDGPAEGPNSRTRATGRPGGKATLSRLLGEGFFKKPKTIKQLVEHCDQNLALKFAQSDFSGALARYVRDGKLKRTKNSDKQYEYSQS